MKEGEFKDSVHPHRIFCQWQETFLRTHLPCNITGVGFFTEPFPKLMIYHPSPLPARWHANLEVSISLSYLQCWRTLPKKRYQMQMKKVMWKYFSQFLLF
jgi:hypothetical protein